jgi:pyridoxamine 5'-phosphate oxidase
MPESPVPDPATARAALDPLREFRELLAEVAVGAPSDITETALATADAQGRPSVRIVLLKGVDDAGFRFFTNYESRKGRELAGNPHAALCWRWPWRELQARAEGRVEKLSAAESDAYFASRPRGHQIGAWASAQSRPIASYAALEEQVAAVAARFADRDVPRPPHWGGYLLRPERIELWRGRADRLHERRLFSRNGDGWRLELLSP